MRKLCSGLVAGIFVLAAVGSANAACTSTGYMKDGNDLTAALINPGNVLAQDVDASGCDIGVYFGPGQAGSVDQGSNVHGAKYFGVLINGAQVLVANSIIHDIGEHPFNFGLIGYGVSCPLDAAARSVITIRGNTIYDYQRNGIDIRGTNCAGAPRQPTRIVANQIVGHGPTPQIAQNGIVLGWGASNVIIAQNSISGHVYTGTQVAASAAMTLLSGPCYGTPWLKNTTINNNRMVSNDVAVFLLNLNASCNNAALVDANNAITDNDMLNYAILNQNGNDPGPYQIGISVTDHATLIHDNNICGMGYAGRDGQPADSFVHRIDPAGSSNLDLSNNVCFNPPAQASTTLADIRLAQAPATRVRKHMQPSP